MSPQMVALQNRTEVQFGQDPWWVVLIKAVLIFVFLVVITLFNIWFERRMVAKMQHRIGPNKNGPFGLLQSLADGVKLMLKEDLMPKNVDKLVFLIAPAISAICAFTAFAVIPFGPVVRIPFTDTYTHLQLTDMPVAVLFVLAVAAVGVYGFVLAGWSSNSTYSLLGALRSSAQLISYEVAMGLALVAVFLYAGSMSTSGIVEAQRSTWYVLALLPSFILYCISMVGETNRAPFDLPEAEGELVAGYATEYSSIKYAMFFLAEYINMVTVSALATTMFLGGWHPPVPFHWFDWAWHGIFPPIWFVGKVVVLIFGFVWLRGTLPRLRYDQFMRLGWRVLIPFSIAWVVIAGCIQAYIVYRNITPTWWFLPLVGIAMTVALAAFLPQRDDMEAEDRATAGGVAMPQRADYNMDDEYDDRDDAAPVRPKSRYAGGFPVPEMPAESARAAAAATAERSHDDPATSGGARG